MAVVNRVLVEVLDVMARAVDVEARAGTETTSSAATTTSTVPSITPTATGSSSSNGPTSSPLLFFVALGFGVVFTNLWIIVGVKYCFRYNARNRQMRVGEDGEPINLENMPRPHRRRREKKLMTMDEVNERFPLTKYKNWVASRASEGLPTAGGVTSPSRAGSVRNVEGIIPESPTMKTSTNVKSNDKSPKSLDKSEATTVELGSRSESQESMADSEKEKAVDSSTESDSPQHLPTLEEVKTTTSTVDPKKIISMEEDDEEDEEHIHTAVPPELLQTPGDTCAICIDTLEDNDDVRGLTCGHAFHASCLDPWLTSRRACCPLCKADYYVPKPRPDGEPVEPERDSRRNRRTDSNGRRMNMPQAPPAGWIGARASPLRGGRMILPGRFMTNATYPGDGYGYATGDDNERRRRGAGDSEPLPPAVEHGDVNQSTANGTPEEGTHSWRSRVHVPNPFNNLRMPTMRMPGRSHPGATESTSNPTPAQLEEGIAH